MDDEIDNRRDIIRLVPEHGRKQYLPKRGASVSFLEPSLTESRKQNLRRIFHRFHSVFFRFSLPFPSRSVGLLTKFELNCAGTQMST